MKLIDFLITESKKGWKWPDGIVKVASTKGSRGVNFYFDYGCPPSLSNTLIAPTLFSSSELVTREKYDAALAASKTEWDGEGLPPVGCVCEVRVCDGFEKCEIVFSHTKSGVAFVYLDEENHGGKCPVDCVSPIPAPSYFRPIRSEADKKKEAAIFAIAELCRGSASNGHSAELIYDAIKSGKIVID